MNGVTETEPRGSRRSPRSRLPRESEVLWLVGLLLFLATYLTFQAHTRLGNTTYPIWFLLGMNGVIAVIGGAVVQFGSDEVEEGFVPPPDSVVIPKAEWTSIQAELSMLRLTEDLGGFPIVPPPEPAVASPSPLAPGSGAAPAAPLTARRRAPSPTRPPAASSGDRPVWEEAPTDRHVEAAFERIERELDALTLESGEPIPPPEPPVRTAAARPAPSRPTSGAAASPAKEAPPRRAPTPTPAVAPASDVPADIRALLDAWATTPIVRAGPPHRGPVTGRCATCGRALGGADAGGACERCGEPLCGACLRAAEAEGRGAVCASCAHRPSRDRRGAGRGNGPRNAPSA